MEFLMKLSSDHPEPVHATREWLREQKGRIICRECNLINPLWYPRPIDVMLQRRPPGKITGGIWWTAVDVFHIGFVAQIHDHLTEFVFGKCYDAKGSLIEDYVTCYTNQHIMQRGAPDTLYRTCNTCGTTWPSGYVGPQYILRHTLTGAKVYQNCSSRMYLDEALCYQLDFSPWPDVDLEPIEIRDEPLDGKVLPGDPAHVDRVEPYRVIS